MKGFEEFLIGKKTITCFEILDGKIHVIQSIERIEKKKCKHPITIASPNSTVDDVCLHCGSVVMDIHFSDNWQVGSADV